MSNAKDSTVEFRSGSFLLSSYFFNYQKLKLTRLEQMLVVMESIDFVCLYLFIINEQHVYKELL